MHSLPSVKNIAAFHAWRANAAQWPPVALDIARGHVLACTTPRMHDAAKAGPVGG